MAPVQFNPFDPQIHIDPYPTYHRLRSEEPVQWNPLLEVWILTRYSDVAWALKEPRLSANRRLAQNRFAQEMLRRQEEFGPFGRSVTMLGADPPEHTRLRRLVSKAFTARMVEGLRPHIQEIVDDLLDDSQGEGRLDIIKELAYPMPVIVIAEVLGVPPQERDIFKSWSDDVAATLGGPFAPEEVLQRGRRSIEEMADYFRRAIKERRRKPREDLLSALVLADEQGQVLSEDELLATCMLLLIAGNETTTNLIGNGMLALLRNPDQLQRLREDPGLIQLAVEELLRYDGPVQMTSRVAIEDIEIDGFAIKGGQVVCAMLGAANRDPLVFPNPDQLDIERADNPHLAFGEGIHFCLGAPLARGEGQIAISTLVRRMPNLRLETDKVEWNPSFILRGLKSLPVAF